MRHKPIRAAEPLLAGDAVYIDAAGRACVSDEARADPIRQLQQTPREPRMDANTRE